MPCSRCLREAASDQLLFQGEDGRNRELHNHLQKPDLNLPSSSVVLVFSVITFEFLGAGYANSPLKSIRSPSNPPHRSTSLPIGRHAMSTPTPQWFHRMQNADECLVSVKAFEGRRMPRLPGGNRRRSVERPLWAGCWCDEVDGQVCQASVLSSNRYFCLVETSASCRVARVCV